MVQRHQKWSSTTEEGANGTLSDSDEELQPREAEMGAHEIYRKSYSAGHRDEHPESNVAQAISARYACNEQRYQHLNERQGRGVSDRPRRDQCRITECVRKAEQHGH